MMDVTIRLTGEETTHELTAILALIAALGGRAAQTAGTTGSVTVTARPDAHAIADALSSEMLMRNEADRVAGHPTSPSDTGTASPAPDSVDPTTGLPWDERIHSKGSDGKPVTNGDGSFRRRRGVDDATIAAVTAELRGAVNPPSAPVAPADTASGAVAADSASEVPAPPAPTPDVPPAPETPAPPPAPTDGARFPTFPALISACNAAGKVYADLNPIAQTLGVSKFPELKDRPDLWDMFYDMVAG